MYGEESALCSTMHEERGLRREERAERGERETADKLKQAGDIW